MSTFNTELGCTALHGSTIVAAGRVMSKPSANTSREIDIRLTRAAEFAAAAYYDRRKIEEVVLNLKRHLDYIDDRLDALLDKMKKEPR